MSLLEAIVLGVIQGITEFLPISSTAHLRFIPELLGWSDPGAAYSAVIQLGTVAAVIIYFARDLIELGAAFFRGLAHGAAFESVQSRLACYVLIGTLPVGIAGVLFKKWIETSFRSLYVIGTSLILLALVLLLAEKLASHRRTLSEMKLRDGVVIGLCQAVALIPGSSRSGTTLTGGLALGFRREDAARYSFLLSIPANSAAGLFELKHLLHATDSPSTPILLLGTAVSFGAGMAAIAGLLRFLRTHSTIVFVGYRVVVGALLLLLLGLGILQPVSARAHPEQERPAAEKQVTD
ncbi:MAG TPA: undecaprenyl-diphosphatase UppP [Myxococcaceae bacterium]|nr:undecaprenyl-diphosphatase UppP [Myxococcaceae bacterium]